MEAKAQNLELRFSMLIEYYNAQDDKQPKTSRLYQACLKMIRGGFWRHGDKIPSEQQLADNLPVGLATVQSVMRKLTAQGFIIRKRKAGSFIADPNSTEAELSYFTFIAENGDDKLLLTDLQISIEKVVDKGEWSEFLPPAQCYIRISRITDVGGEFQLFNQLFLDHQMFAQLLEEDANEFLNVSFRSMLRDRYAIPPTTSDRRVSFSQISLETSKMLNCAYGMAAMQYDVRQFTLENKPLFFMRTFIPQNSCILQTLAP